MTGVLTPNSRSIALPTATCSHRSLGLTTAVHGVRLCPFLPLPPRKSHPRGLGPVQAVVSPAVLKALQVVVTRAAPGKLLLEATRRGGMKLGAPVVVALLLTYSVAATLWAARQTARAQALESGVAETDGEGLSDNEAAATLSDGEGAVPCPMCDGQGVLVWRARDDMPCPKCLGSGTLRNRRW